MSKRAWGIGALLIIVCLTGILLLKPENDAALSQELVGRWTAVDPSNPTLHRHESGVIHEAIEVRSDGTLTYEVTEQPAATCRPASAKAAPPSETPAPRIDRTLWGWKVHKGRLLLRDLGEGSTREWLPPLKFEVSDSTLSISRRKHNTKAFNRAEEG